MSKKQKPTSQPAARPKTTAAATQAGTPLWEQHWFWPAALALAAFILYVGSLGHGFVLDDALVTELNNYVKRGIGGIGDILSHSYRAGANVSTDSEYMYRPLSVALFAFEWSLAKNTPGIHHFMNVLWYAGGIALTFNTLRKVFGTAYTLPLALGMLLFVAHPLHTEVVANIKSRDEILSFFFSILTLSWLWDAAEGAQPRKLAMAMGAFLFALLAKEGAVTMLLLAPLALYFFGKNSDWRKSLQYGALLLAPFLLWYVLRYMVMKGNTSYIPNVNDNQLAGAAFDVRLGTGLLVLFKYFVMQCWPARLSWDYSFNEIPSVGLSDWRAILSALLHTALLGLGIWGFKRRNAYAFFSLAYLISLGLYCNLFLLIGTLFGERLAFMASLWFCLALVWALWQLIGQKNRTAFLALAALLALAYSVRTFQRVPEWESNYTLFTADTENAPNSFRTWQGAGEQYLIRYSQTAEQTPDTALLRRAEDCFKRSLAIKKTATPLLGLGNVASFRKQYEQASELFKASLAEQPLQLTRQRLAATYRDWGRQEGMVNKNLDKAITCFTEALRYDSTQARAWEDLGTAYGLANRHAEAAQSFESGLRFAPQDAALRRNAAMAYRLMGNEEKAKMLEK
jgi:protein O-mannosyl-transferase